MIYCVSLSTRLTMSIHHALNLHLTQTPMDLSSNEYEAIERIISSEESVVGIDAKKTHIIIIHMLQQITEKLDSLEQRLEKLGG